MGPTMPTGVVQKGNEFQIDQYNQWMLSDRQYQRDRDGARAKAGLPF